MNTWNFVFVLLAFFASANTDTPRLDGKIVGGHEVEIEDFPHQVSLQQYGRHNCGGIIVSKNYVLTAAHCLSSVLFQQDKVLAGSSDRKDYDFGLKVVAGTSDLHNGGTVHRVTNVIKHKGHSRKSMDYDFGLLKVYPPFNLESKNYAVIKIADVEPPENLEVFATGWGHMMVEPWMPSKLRGVSLKIVSQKACAYAYSEITNLTDRMICAAAPGKDSCAGDSGGPLIDPKTKILYGIASWGIGCANPRFPGVYANVAHQKDWIKRLICG